jgi:Tfp pilus assembly protein PilV
MVARRRGIALIELIAAAVIFGIATMAAFQAWRLCFKLSAEGKEMALASQIARAELEVSKIQGFNNVPIGTMVAGSNPATGTWTEATKYHDLNGLSLASGASEASRYFSSVRSVKDVGVLKSTSSVDTYALATTTLRSVIVKVTRVSDNTQLVRMGIHLTKGGL